MKQSAGYHKHENDTPVIATSQAMFRVVLWII